MAVEEVNMPARSGNNVDPKNVGTKKIDDETYWERQARAARAKREYMEEHKLAQQVAEPPPPPESPIQIKGSINLGDMNLQDQQKQLMEQSNKAVEEARTETRKAQEKAEEEKNKRSQLEIQTIATDLNNKLAQLAQAVQTTQVKPKSFAEQYQEILQLSETLGLKTAGAPVNHGAEDAKFRLETLRLEHDLKLEERKFQRQCRDEDRRFALDMKKLEIDQKFREQELLQSKERSALFPKALETIGRVAAQAVIDADANPTTRVAQNPQPANTKRVHIEAGIGDSGEIPCPQCNTKIGVGPTTAQAKCVKCGLVADVIRVNQPTAPPPTQNQQIPGISPFDIDAPMTGEEDMDESERNALR